MNSVLWGCPNFVPITVAAGDSRSAGGAGGVALVYTGYGMNGFPEYTARNPVVGADPLNAIGDTVDPNAVSSVDCSPAYNWSNITSGRWYKQKAYTSAADRALVGDCRAYVLEAFAVTSDAAIPGQADLNSPSSVFWVGPYAGETSYDFYRHGTYPRRSTNNQFNASGGKVGYNVLFADGHASTLVQRSDGFRAARLRFPG